MEQGHIGHLLIDPGGFFFQCQVHHQAGAPVSITGYLTRYGFRDIASRQQSLVELARGDVGDHVGGGEGIAVGELDPCCLSVVGLNLADVSVGHHGCAFGLQQCDERRHQFFAAPLHQWIRSLGQTEGYQITHQIGQRCTRAHPAVQATRCQQCLHFLGLDLGLHHGSGGFHQGGKQADHAQYAPASQGLEQNLGGCPGPGFVAQQPEHHVGLVTETFEHALVHGCIRFGQGGDPAHTFGLVGVQYQGATGGGDHPHGVLVGAVLETRPMQVLGQCSVGRGRDELHVGGGHKVKGETGQALAI